MRTPSQLYHAHTRPCGGFVRALQIDIVRCYYYYVYIYAARGRRPRIFYIYMTYTRVRNILLYYTHTHTHTHARERARHTRKQMHTHRYTRAYIPRRPYTVVWAMSSEDIPITRRNYAVRLQKSGIRSQRNNNRNAYHTLYRCTSRIPAEAIGPKRRRRKFDKIE
jgi:hypothetical protein